MAGDSASGSCASVVDGCETAIGSVVVVGIVLPMCRLGLDVIGSPTGDVGVSGTKAEVMSCSTDWFVVADRSLPDPMCAVDSSVVTGEALWYGSVSERPVPDLASVGTCTCCVSSSLDVKMSG